MVDVSQEAIDALAKAVAGLSPKAEAKAEAKQEKEEKAADSGKAAAKPEDYKFERKDGKVFCTGPDCNETYVQVGSPDAVLKTLNEVYHKNHDSLSCPECRPLIDKTIEKMGYEVRDSLKGGVNGTGELVIRPKRK